ncbi:MAG: CapA family protein [Deltaproteobacteria bacterium]|nr:MAG: CapA family protein [Deltaproteobacteria bacterium]
MGRHYARRLAVFREPGFLGLREVLQSADARFANLESMVVRYVEGTPTLRTGTPIERRNGLGIIRDA